MIYGYARVSTKGQARDGNSLEYQQEKLKEYGATEIYIDTFTGKVTSRPELDKLLSVMQKGDTMVVTKLDRIARSVVDGSVLIEKLQDEGIKIHILNMGLIDTSPTGKLIQHIMLAFAEFERSLIIQRTLEGKQIARQRPGYREGRPPKYTSDQIRRAVDLLESHSYSQVSKMTGIGRATLCRKRKEIKDLTNQLTEEKTRMSGRLKNE